MRDNMLHAVRTTEVVGFYSVASSLTRIALLIFVGAGSWYAVAIALLLLVAVVAARPKGEFAVEWLDEDGEVIRRFGS